MAKQDTFVKRLERHHDELRWLYMELYNNGDMFAELCDQLKEYYDNREESLKLRDSIREENPYWYRKTDVVGMMLYIDNFSGDLKTLK